MAHRLFFCCFLICSCSIIVVSAAQGQSKTAKQTTTPKGDSGIKSGHPNAEFADLLKSKLFNAKIGTHSIPFSKKITIEGVVEKPYGQFERGSLSRAVIRAFRVDGKITDENQVAFYVFGPKSAEPSLARNSNYRMTGFIRDGLENDGWSKYSFELSQAAEKFDPPKTRKPDKKVRVSLTGQTINRNGQAHLRTKTGVYQLLQISPWMESMVGKTVKLTGKVQQKSNIIDVVSYTFLDLSKLMGSDIELIGTTWSMNDHWWFVYNDTKIVISQYRKRPGFESVGHGHQARVKGRLVKELRPSLDQITLKTCRDLVPHYVIKKAELKNLSPGQSRFFFRNIYNSSPTFSDGVLNLYEEEAMVYNLLPWMNTAILMYWRNSALIEEIIKRDSPQTREVLKRRLQDAHRGFELRLLYAGILASVNDKAGRQFILTHAANHEHKSLDSIFWVLGNLHEFPPLPEVKEVAEEPTGKSQKLSVDPTSRVDTTGLAEALFGEPISSRPLGNVEMQWAEQVMIDALKNDNLSFVDLIIKMKSKRGIEFACKRMLEFDGASRKKGAPKHTSALRNKLLRSLMVTDHPKVIELATKMVHRSGIDSNILRNLQYFLYRHDRALSINSLIDSVNEWYAFQLLLKLGKKEVLAPLDARLSHLNGDARKEAQILKILLTDDSPETLLKEVHKADCQGRNTKLYWLARRKNEKVAQQVSRLLKDSPKDFFKEGEISNTNAVQHAINACSVENSLVAVRELISLLDSNLGRFDVYTKSAEFNNLVAAHLIELTDVSFGTDKSKWEAWFKKGHPGFDPDKKTR